MRFTFTVTVDLDETTVASLAARQHRPSGDVVAEIASDVECRLSDAVRFRDAVERVGIALLKTPELLQPK